MIALSALSTKSLLNWGITSTVSDSELSVLQNNQKAPEKTSSLGDFHIQNTNPKLFVRILLLEDLQPELSTDREARVGECSLYSPRAGAFPPRSRLTQSQG